MLPQILQYDQAKPKGFATKQHKQLVYSQNEVNSLADTAQFKFNTNKWIDPFNSYFEFTLKYDLDSASNKSTEQIGVNELDGQSTSLISQMKIFSRQVLIEQIDEYDQIGQILNDLHLNPELRQSKTYEGMGYEQFYSNMSAYNNLPSAQQLCISASATQSQMILGNASLRPEHLKNKTSVAMQGPVWAPIAVSSSDVPNALKYISRSVVSTDPLFQTNCAQNFASTYAQYDAEFGIQHADSDDFDVGVKADIAGYSIPFSNQLSAQKSQYFCPIAPAVKVNRGKFLRTSIFGDNANSLNDDTKILTTRMIAPILSGVLGILVPQEDFKLIPGLGLGDVEIRLKLNPYAYFSEGMAINTAASVVKRRVKVVSVTLVLAQWEFSHEIEDLMKQKLNSAEGLILSTQTWKMLQQLRFDSFAGQKITLGAGVSSAKCLLFWFLSDKFRNFDFCRKQFRLSNQVVSCQLCADDDYYPPFPTKGNAGNVQTSLINDDNTNFVLDLHRTFGKLFAVDDYCGINKLNFALNERCYNPENIQHTSFGKALFHERRCVGKALFAINLDSNPNDYTVLSGLDLTTRNAVLDIQTECIYQNEPSTFYCMANCDLYVQFKLDSCRSFGIV